MDALPVRIPDTHSGFSDTEGLLKIEGDEIVLESKTVFLGMVPQPVSTVRIALDSLTSIEIEKKLMLHSVKLRSNSMQALDVIPNAKAGEAKLRFKKAHLPIAEAIVSHIALIIAQRRLSQLDENLRALDDEASGLY